MPKNYEKDDVSLLDVVDQLSQYRNALGFIADNINDPQASAAVHLIYDSMEITEEMLKFIMESGPASTEQ